MIIREGKSWVYAIFAVVVLSSALGNLSQTGLNAMLVTVCEEFGISTGVGQWLTTVYMFVLGAVVPLSSYLMGRFRLKDLTLASIGIFIIGAFMAACAANYCHDALPRRAQGDRHGNLGRGDGLCSQYRAYDRWSDGRYAGLAQLFRASCGAFSCHFRVLSLFHQASRRRFVSVRVGFLLVRALHRRIRWHPGRML